MKNECSIIRDILPLYAEGIVSDDTTCFVEAHLKGCNECSSIYKDIKDGGLIMKNEDENTEREVINVMKKTRKKVFKRIFISAFSICFAVLVIVVSLQIFPVYRLFQYNSNYEFIDEHKNMLVYIGSSSDRKIATDILNYADNYVFPDVSHTYEENLRLYGELGRYPFEKNIFDEEKALYETHSIKLLSANINTNHGYMFVEYSQQAIGENAEVVSSSLNVLSLWEIQQDDNGNWKVVKITEQA